MMHVTMRNGTPGLIADLTRQASQMPVEVAQEAARLTRENVPPGVWQQVLQSSVYTITSEGSDYQQAASAYSSLVVSTLRDLAIQGLADLTYHNLNDIAAPLPPREANMDALITSCADIDKLNSIGVGQIGSTIWDDIAGHVEAEL